MKTTDMFPRRYATGEDLQGKAVTLVIARLAVETAVELLALALQYERLDPEQRQTIESQVNRLDSTITELLIIAMERPQ